MAAGGRLERSLRDFIAGCLGLLRDGRYVVDFERDMRNSHLVEHDGCALRPSGHLGNYHRPLAGAFAVNQLNVAALALGRVPEDVRMLLDGRDLVGVELHPEEIAVRAERFLHVFNGYREVFDSPDGHGFLLSLSRRYGFAARLRSESLAAAHHGYSTHLAPSINA